MAEFEFRPAKRENVGLLIGLAGGTGSGKTFTALRLAAGASQGKPFAVIDTESRRALHYADKFNFHHAEFRAPFTPERYEAAILKADAAGFPVIVVDSMSHEWAGEGGLLEWHDAELDRMAGTDYRRRDAMNVSAWIKPKSSHKQMVQRLLQVRSHLILCLRAEEKIEMVRDEKGKMQIIPKRTRTGLDGWVPICEKALPFELTCSFLLTAEAPGIPKPIKLQEQHRALFPTEEQITEESGKHLAEWAAGGQSPRQGTAGPVSSAASKSPDPAGVPASAERQERDESQYISENDVAALYQKCTDHGIDVSRLERAAGVQRLGDILKEKLAPACEWVDKAIKQAESKAHSGATNSQEH